ncbi:hypothetical protein [Bacillus pinisoli]|uniref:hypothetical protein n=1 Tax=Bacillus pinisoli TaxID=2901866 RepID=UPI001FF2D2FB|nr:hypothetical protein [Bacillus pinisoli]
MNKTLNRLEGLIEPKQLLDLLLLSYERGEQSTYLTERELVEFIKKELLKK